MVADKKIIREFWRFVVVGMINTAVTYSIFVIANRYLHYTVAYSISFVLGIGLSYALNVIYVFGGGHSISAMIKFPVIYFIQFIYGSLILFALVEWGGISANIAMPIVIATSALGTFFLMRLVFSSQERRATQISKE